ncbi:hypothetical protein PTKIN_Ptkin17bG0074300 [Pterospermum kingtungense]
MFFSGISEDNTSAKIFEARVHWAKLENGRQSPFDVFFCKEKASDEGDDERWLKSLDPYDYEESEDDKVDESERSHYHSSKCLLSDEDMEWYMEQYMAALEASDGFEVPDFGDVPLDSSIIQPLKLDPLDLEALKPLCVAAMDWYNNEKFLELEKANMQSCCCITYYLTLVGRIPDANATKNFEAKVHLGVPKIIGGGCAVEVYFCREKATEGVFIFNSFFFVHPIWFLDGLVTLV